nr:JAB domain-containing protein [Acetoanaerobium pronyense]
MKYIEADNEFISYRNENTFSGLYNYPEYKETLFIHEENNEIKDFSNYENYNEFSSFLAERENQNLNIITDIEKIKTNLKLGFQHEKQEIFGCILYDDDYKIQKSINIFKGGVSSSIVDPRILFQEILKNESAGFIVYHNHPSGTTKPSNEDMIITKRISTISEQLGLQFCDHFIIGKEQILSFAKEVDSMLFNNIDYTIDVVNAKESDSIYKAQYKDFEDTKKTISNMIYSNYENYVKAILSLEKGIEDINILNKAFDMFMSDDSMFLLDEKIDSIIELAKKLVVLDKKKNIAKENISDKSKNKLSNNEKMSKESKKLDQIL